VFIKGILVSRGHMQSWLEYLQKVSGVQTDKEYILSVHISVNKPYLLRFFCFCHVLVTEISEPSRVYSPSTDWFTLVPLIVLLPRSSLLLCFFVFLLIIWFCLGCLSVYPSARGFRMSLFLQSDCMNKFLLRLEGLTRRALGILLF